MLYAVMIFHIQLVQKLWLFIINQSQQVDLVRARL